MYKNAIYNSDIWKTIHSRLADYGFILRYLPGKEHITGYRSELWHIRYLDSVETAKKIMSQTGLTLEEYLAGKTAPEVTIDLGTSKLYTEEELYNAMLAIKCQFAFWAGCKLHSIQYAGDEECTEENLEWLRTLGNGKDYKDIAAFLMDFHSPVEDGPYAWEPDTEYQTTSGGLPAKTERTLKSSAAATDTYYGIGYFC